ncbi:tetratricopeptide repeat protein [Ferrimonas sediminicola]|uniref:Ancillary SecYEG translocon subunit n=1 Tax=Ferrimonas sediminicola TaxID=2569538 RepID=A0A4U1BJF6_9GAMM|nr:tetratricopeptide repeat protein [Ferrimonas sediminicola]TKB51559.1 tetratricopeptide repeat protein [Ferrimonas sediminicola]
MEIYSTEEQQVEAIKSFWKEYGNSIIGGAAIGLAALFGWNTFQEYRIGQQEAASEAFDATVQKAGERDALAAAVDELRLSHGDSAYADLATLMLAKAAADAGDLTQAEQRLSDVAASIDADLKPLVDLRLARIQLALGKSDQALATLNLITPDSFAAQRDELKGDLLKQKGDLQGAREAYQAALNAGSRSPALQMKLDDLAN